MGRARRKPTGLGKGRVKLSRRLFVAEFRRRRASSARQEAPLAQVSKVCKQMLGRRTHGRSCLLVWKVCASLYVKLMLSGEVRA